MRMLRSLSIENFELILKSHLEFDEKKGFNSGLGELGLEVMKNYEEKINLYVEERNHIGLQKWLNTIVSDYIEQEIIQEFFDFVRSKHQVDISEYFNTKREIKNILKRGKMVSREEYDLLNAYFQVEIAQREKWDAELRKVSALLESFEEN